MNIKYESKKSLAGVSVAAVVAAGLFASSIGVANADPATGLVGSGCAGYAKQNPNGPASVMGMSQVPVATAASNNPMLKTLTQAVSGQLNPNVNLVDTLNGAPSLTVFAPTDAAFAKLDPATIEQLTTDSDLLTSFLTYHVVDGQASPSQVVGMHKTMQGGDVTVTGKRNDLEVNNASVVCGGVRTANATVYMVDTVLMPPAPPAM
jgi:uncharacterized surface protein with fasciclin (FAS1) repeats